VHFFHLFVVLSALFVGFSVLRAIARVFRLTPPPPPPAEKLGLVQACLAFGAFLLFGALFFLLTWLWMVGLTDVAEERLSRLPAAAFRLHPEGWAFWIGPRIFLGLVSAGVLAYVPARIWFWRRYQEQRRIDRLGVVQTIVTLIVLVGYVVLAKDWYSQFEEDRIVISPFWSFGEEIHAYQDVDKIIRTSHLRTLGGDEVPRTRYFLVFADGRSWNADDYPPVGSSADAIQQFHSAWLQFLLKKTGKPVTDAKHIEEMMP
jgi:hypothetical protein